MEINASQARFNPVDLRSMEEAADTVNLLVFDLAIQVLERKTEGDFSKVDGVSLLNMAERGMNLTAIMSSIMSKSTVA